MCVDLRAVNEAVIKDRFPLPTSEELIAQFHGSTMFSKLDLRQGYLQVPLLPSSRNPTVFFDPCRCVLLHVYAVWTYLRPQLYDVVIHGPTTESNDEHLSRVFAALAENKLTINAEKFVFSAPNSRVYWFPAVGGWRHTTSVKCRRHTGNSRTQLSCAGGLLIWHDSLLSEVPSTLFFYHCSTTASST